eukprot:Em0118g9a
MDRLTRMRRMEDVKCIDEAYETHAVTGRLLILWMKELGVWLMGVEKTNHWDQVEPDNVSKLVSMLEGQVSKLDQKLSYDLTRDDLKSFFKNAANVTLPMSSGKNRGFAFIEFKNQEDYDRALAQNGANLKGRRITSLASQTCPCPRPHKLVDQVPPEVQLHGRPRGLEDGQQRDGHGAGGHGDGKAIGQHKKPIYNTPKPSVDSLPPSYNRRFSTSTSSGYHSQTKVPIYDTPKPSVDYLSPFYNRPLSTSTSSGYQSQTNITSPASTSGSPSVHSETIPPVQRDHHPGRLGCQISAPCNINPRRIVSQPIGSTSSLLRNHTPRSSCHLDDPAFFDCSLASEEDLHTDYPVGQLDQESVADGSHAQRRSATIPLGPSLGRGHTQNRCHTTAMCKVPRGVNGGSGCDEYEQMIHPSFAHRAVYKDPDYVYMHPAVSRTPDSSQSPAAYPNYDYVPPASSLSTISKVERPTPYENHPLPRDLQNVVPVTFQPRYENVETVKRSIV